MANQKNNKWSDKLNQLPTPDETESWSRMEALLNTHLPKQKSNWRYAAIALLLLLLVVGICNYPRLTNNYSADNTGGVERQIGSGKREKTPVQLSDAIDTKDNIDTQNVISKKIHKSKDEHKPKGRFNYIHSSGNRRNNIAKRNQSHLNTSIIKSYTKPASSTSANLIISKEQSLTRVTAGNDLNNVISVAQPTSSEPSGIDKADSSSTALVKDSVLNDSINTKAGSVKKQAKQKNTKLSFGTGLNYFFAVNNQERSTVNTKGYNSNWSNFFPVIMGRYYVKEWIYFQAELQLSAPQYTSKILIDKKTSPLQGPSPAANSRVEKSIFTNKFFYVDVPFSLNVSPVKNVFFGGGLQYSHLRKAIGLHEEKIVATGRPDSITSTQIKQIEENLATASFKKNEWRYNLNATVKLNRFDAGLRYTKSFHPFTTNLVTGYSKSKTTNSSLSLFLRYELVRLGLR